MRYIGIIPARFASSRFPGKPIADLCGHPVIEHVYRRVSMVLDDVWVATDDIRIADVVRGFDGNVVMTSSAHCCGTERCREAFVTIDSEADIVIDIQGDEPFIDPEAIRILMACMECNDNPGIGTLSHRIYPLDCSVLTDPNRPKVIVDNDMYAVSFLREADAGLLAAGNIYRHIGVYAFRSEILSRIALLPRSDMEKRYSLEQYRWLENGYRIRVGVCPCTHTVAIDTPADLEIARKYYIDHIDCYDNRTR